MSLLLMPPDQQLAAREAVSGRASADMLGQVMMQLLARNNLTSEHVDQVVGGCVNKLASQGMNITRTAWLASGGIIETPCITIDSQCGSSQQSTLAHNIICSGAADVVMACGVENMTRVPIGSDAIPANKKMGKPIGRSYFEQREFTSQFEAAERLAEKYQLTRSDTDNFGLRSQTLAKAAIEGGHFDSQIIEIEAPEMDDDFERTDTILSVSRDEVPRDTSLEALAELKSVAREDGVHTAGTSSQIADGAAAVLMMRASKANELGLTPVATIRASALVGCDPVMMLEGPIPATEKMLKQTGLSIDDIDVFESMKPSLPSFSLGRRRLAPIWRR